jgi:uncharacterized protein (DUF1697 family)
VPSVVAFLRAINTGERRVTNARLVEVVAGAGFADVRAYQAAGNLLLDPGDLDPPAVEQAVEAAIAAGLGYAAETFVRNADDLVATLTAEPFPTSAVEAAAAAGGPAKPQIGFLRDPVDEATAEAVAALSTATDHVVVIGRELHWLPLDGVGRSPLDLTAAAALLGPLTVRTRGTVERIADKLTSS